MPEGAQGEVRMPCVLAGTVDAPNDDVGNLPPTASSDDSPTEWLIGFDGPSWAVDRPRQAPPHQNNKLQKVEEEVCQPDRLDQVVPKAVDHTLHWKLVENLHLGPQHPAQGHEHVEVKHIGEQHTAHVHVEDVVRALREAGGLGEQPPMPLDLRLSLEGLVRFEFPCRQQHIVSPLGVATIDTSHRQVLPEAIHRRPGGNVVLRDVLDNRVSH
mmetsp:Transcript_88576/g.185102  ORF Transcript_88576/g.185102 Transcript_88576/m.185102 type:complete len:213 (+) Transcript_88576:1364-2002(+)